MSKFKIPWELTPLFLLLSGCGAFMVAPISAPIWLIVTTLFALRIAGKFLWLTTTLLSLYQALILALLGLGLLVDASQNKLVRFVSFLLAIAIPILVGLTLYVPYQGNYSDLARLWGLIFSFASVIVGVAFVGILVNSD